MTRAIYVRTSVDDNDGAAQLHELRQYAQGRGWEGWTEYIDRGESGAKDSRPSWDALRASVRKGIIKEWCATEISRLGRGGAAQVTPFLEECSSRGVRVTLTRQGCDFSTPIGACVLGILAEVAKMERAMATERIRAGVRKAKERGTRSGKPIGRPRVDVSPQLVKDYRASGWSWARIAETLKVGQGTARRLATACQNPAKIEAT